MSALNESLVQDMKSRFGNFITTAQISDTYGNAVYQKVARGGLVRKAHGVYFTQLANSAIGSNIESISDIDEIINNVINREELERNIEERFDVLDIVTGGLVAGHVNGVVISGAPGVGKTYTVEQRLNSALESNKIKSIKIVKGAMSAIGLYILCYENKEKGQVILIDDTDSIFSDEEALNQLKAALDSGSKRMMSWEKKSTYLADSNIPNSFDYNGQIIFVTNKNLDAIADKGGTQSAHISAFLSRVVYLDLGIHTNEQIMIRIEQVIAKSPLLHDIGLSRFQGIAILDWMRDNLSSLRNISLRTVLSLGSMVKSTEDWQKVARVTLIKHN